MEQPQLEQLKKLGIIFNTDKIVSEEDVKKVLKAVLEIFETFFKKTTEINTATKADSRQIQSEIRKELASLKEKVSSDIGKNDEKIRVLFDKAIIKCQKIANDVLANKPKDGAPGQKGEDGSPDTPQEVRDKLESLEKGEKLTIHAIEDLADILEDLKKKIEAKEGKSSGGVTRVLSPGKIRFIDDFTPIGTINGINTVFTLPKTPATGSLKVYRNGSRQRVGEDYTFDGHRTITFLIAPMADKGDGLPEVLLVDFRY